MGILNWLASKALGVPSAEELTEKSLSEICRVNSISQYDYKVYTQPSFSDSRFKHRTYVGDAVAYGKKQGFVIEIDEGTGAPQVIAVSDFSAEFERTFIKSILSFSGSTKLVDPSQGFLMKTLLGIERNYSRMSRGQSDCPPVSIRIRFRTRAQRRSGISSGGLPSSI